MFQHEVHLLCCDLLGGDDQIALVFAVLIIHNDDKLALCEVLNGFFYAVQLHLFHVTPYLYIVVNAFVSLLRIRVPAGSRMPSSPGPRRIWVLVAQSWPHAPVPTGWSPGCCAGPYADASGTGTYADRRRCPVAE